MYELIQVGAQSYYIQSPAKIGVYVPDENHVYLIDSGNDKDAGRKIKKILDQKGWKLKGILNTHSHADHIGGNQYLQNQTDCKVFTGGIEAAFTAFPELEPAFLYGGYPFKELKHKFLMAQSCEVSDITDEDYPVGVTPIGLCGHSFRQTGYHTPDGTVYLADCLNSEETLKKYGICFLYNVQAYLDTLDYVAQMREISGLDIRYFVPSHADATDDIQPLVQQNKGAVLETAERILSFCVEPVMFEELLQKVFTDFALTMTYEQYVLIGSTVRSYLSWLKDSGRIQTKIENNRLLWHR